MKLDTKTAFFGLLALCLTACGDKLDPITGEDASDATPSQQVSAASATSANLCNTGSGTITYATHAKTVLNASCSLSGCHDTASKTNGVVTDTFSGATSAFKTRGAQDEIDSKRMPRSGQLSADQLCILDNWAKGGLAP